MPQVVLVTPRHSYRTGAFLDAAGALGCAVTVVTDAEIAVPGAAVVVDLDDEGAATAVETHVGTRPDAVVGTDGSALVMAAHLAEHFGLPGSPVEAVRVALDKRLQRAAADRAGVRQPEWTAVVADAVWPDLGGGAAVVKPTNRQAGQGVIRADTAEAGREALARVRALTGPHAPVLVERYVPGREVAVDALIVDGEMRPVAVFDKPDAGSGPFFDETLLVQPARLSTAERNELLALVDGAVQAVGLTHGPVHVEARIDTKGRAWFLELAPRSIGGLCSRALRHLPAPLEQLIVAAALGRVLPDSVAAVGPATGVYMIPVPGRGVLEGVTGLDRAASTVGITGIEITVGVGSTVVPLPDGDRYVGFLFAEGDEPGDVEASLRAATGILEVSVSPSGSTDQNPRRDR